MTVSVVAQSPSGGHQTAIGTGSESFSLPGTPLEGDYAQVSLVSDQSFSGADKVLTSGYVEIYDGGTQNPAAQSFRKRMGSTPDSSVLVEQNDNRIISVHIALIRGADATTPIDATPTTSSGASGEPDPPSFTTVTPGALRVALGYTDDDDVLAYGGSGPPSGWGDYGGADSGTSSTANGGSVQFATLAAPTAGSVDPGVFGAGDDAWEAVHFAYRPAATGIDGTLSATLGAATLTATGALAIAGTLSATLAAATLYAVETLPGGTLSATLADATLTSTGALAISGSVSATLEDAELYAFESTASEGSVTVTLGAVTMTSESIYSPPPPGIDDYPPIIPAVASAGTFTPEFTEWLRQLVDEVRELRAASNDYESRISDLEP